MAKDKGSCVCNNQQLTLEKKKKWGTSKEDRLLVLIIGRRVAMSIELIDNKNVSPSVCD
jgi:hypothetical protein